MTTIASDVPAVSVVICTNYCDEYFYRALASIEGQVLKNIEILIIGNGLSDKDFESLTERAVDPRTRVFRGLPLRIAMSRYCVAWHRVVESLIPSETICRNLYK